MSEAAPRTAGVIGWPIAHSLSPWLHGYWLNENHILGHYLPLAVRREDFANVVRALRLAGFVGVNVTLPHKEAAFALAHAHDRASEGPQAANLLLFREDGSVEARNSDVGGLAISLGESLGKDSLKDGAVVLIGAGGAARATIFALCELGVREIHILNRNRARAETLAATLQPRAKPRLRVHNIEAWPAAAAGAMLLINASSAGMKGADTLDLALDPLPRAAAVCDLVYNPVETSLLHQARSLGHVTVDGLGMFVHQAVPAFEAFFGTRPAVSDTLRLALAEMIRD